MIMRRMNTMLGRIIALILALVILVQCGQVVAAEPRSYQPPANTPVIPWKRFSIEYAVRIVGNALTSKVEFYITNDGGLTWTKYGEDPDKISPMVISVPSEGTYGLITAVSTNVRPSFAPRPGTRPDRFVIVDRTPPTAEWLSPNAEKVLLTDAGVELVWSTSDLHLGLSPVDIEYSTDGGNFWLPLRDKLPAKGSINWNPPVLEGQTDITLRLIATDLAGNKRIVKNKTTFSLDNTPPVVTILGPTSSGDFNFDVEYTATDSDTSVKKVELFYTVDGGTEWFYFGPDEDLSTPIHFNAPAAKEVGLYIVATDKNGNANPTPVRGAMPMAYVTLDMEPPQVDILPPFTTSGQVIAKDEAVDIRWTASDINIKDNSAIIQLSRDGGATWTDLTFDQPANGYWQWIPSVVGNNLLLKISVSDVMGNIGTAISMPFSVDEKRPTMQFESITPINNGQDRVINSQQDYAPQNNDIWAPPVPSTNELESETIDDLPAKTVADVQNDNALGNPFAPVEEVTESETITEELPSDDMTISDLDIPAPIEEDGVPTLDDSFANNEITDEEFSPVDSENDPLNIESFSEENEAILAPQTNDGLDDLGDLGLDSIPDVPQIAEETKETNTETANEPIDNGNEFDVIPEPESFDTDDSMGGDDMAIPDIPTISDTASENTDTIEEVDTPTSTMFEETTTQEAIPAIPDLPAPTDTEGGDDFGLGLPPVDNVTEETTETLDLPLDFDAELPAEPLISTEDILAQAQTAFEEEEDLDTAETLAKQVIKQDPENAQAYAIVASVLTEKGNYDSAFDYAHKAINLAPESAEYLQILGYAQYQKAVEINKMLSSSDLNPNQASNLGTQLMTSLDQAQAAYSKMISSTNDADVKEGYYRLAQVDYFKATRVMDDEVQVADTLRKAIANYQKAYSIGEPDYREVLQIGICNYRLTDYDQSEQWLEKAQEIAPVGRTPKEAFFYLALINEKTDRNEEALPFWQKVAEFYPEGSSYRKLAETRIAALSGL